MDCVAISRRAALAGGLAALLPARPALAAYPERPVRWIVGYAAGGGTDILARLVGGTMSQKLGQQMVIENRPGAATNLGAEAAAKAAPDGYTVFTAGIETLVYNPALYKTLPFDPDKDFRPIGLMARFHLVLTVKRDSSAASARDLIERARAEPGRIDYGSPGLGSPHRLAMERLAKEAGLRFNHVPYRGMAPVITDLLGGTVEAAIVDYAAGGEVLRSGQLRPLAICSAQRLDSLPNVPTVQEALGLRGFEAYAWQGLVVPARTPDVIADRLAEELGAALKQEPVRNRMREIGLETLTGGPDEFKALIAAERAVWVPLIRDLGITLE
jgi:tripartite-type tricarboxylate transporter receptor subunit TctC